ncbi:hypothetical protein HWV62_5033 [Athelia sp. TMB]|nr:hypothetical protein HWV62_5033 [Athelia sp. TMB]
MLTSAIRAAARPAFKAATRTASRSTVTSIRAISTTQTRLSDAHGHEHGHIANGDSNLFGPGAPAGQVPTEVEQATGLDRLELLAEMQGQKLFDEEPLPAEFTGTKENPVLVYSLDTERLIGCTGSPADSHDLHWFMLKEEKNRRCPECGSVYKLDFHGNRKYLEEQAHAHH